MNLGNTTVDTTAQLDGNGTLNNAPPAGGVAGALKISVDGIVQTFNYNTAAGQNSDTVDDFINSFNAGHFGVTASYSSTSQTVVFSRDPNNIDLVHRAAMAAAGGTTTPDFTISDATSAAVQPIPGTAAGGLLDALGADGINGVNQNASNAIGVTNGGNVTSMLQLFTNSYGVPSLQTTDGNIAATVPGPITTTGNNPAFADVNVGDILTIDAGTVNQENVTVSAVNRINGTITFTTKNPHATVNFTITSAQVAPLQQSYANLVAQMGQDSATANTGLATQTSLSSSINAVRQSTDGINVDEETQNLVKFQNAYGAAAHVISVLSSMLEDAINLGTGTTF
jgi:flagellar hook-associated protein FlgK